MLRALLRLIIVAIVVVAAIAFFTGYRFGRPGPADTERPAGTAGHTSGTIDTGRARESGAKVGEAVAESGNRAAELMSEGTLVAKIKSKMALDDTVKALDVHVSNDGGNVTLSGYVHSEKERQRAVALARETNGVRSVTDHLQIR